MAALLPRETSVRLDVDKRNERRVAALVQAKRHLALAEQHLFVDVVQRSTDPHVKAALALAHAIASLATLALMHEHYPEDDE